MWAPKEAYERRLAGIFISEITKISGSRLAKIREILDAIQTWSSQWSEAYLDVTENKLGIKSTVNSRWFSTISGMMRNWQLRQAFLIISFWPRLPVTKPHGLTVILPGSKTFSMLLTTLWILPNFINLVRKAVEIMKMEIYTNGKFTQIPKWPLIDKFGQLWFDLYRKARGISSPVSPIASVSQSGRADYAKLLYDEDIV